MKNANSTEEAFLNHTPDLENLPVEISEAELKNVNEIMKRFMDSYREQSGKVTDQEWLFGCYKRELPDWEDEKLHKLTEDTLFSIQEYGENLRSAEAAAKQGVSSEKWFTNRVTEASKGVAINEFGNKLNQIDLALSNGNAQMMRTVMTNAGEISQCRNLDGFIAEQHHVSTFNANAALKGNTTYEAVVKVPGPGETYGKNSFDIVVKNRVTGKTVQQYQAKYGATAEETIKLLKSGNYNNQRFLVPSDQVKEVQAAFPGKTVTDRIGGKELGDIISSPLTKAEAKGLQNQVQSSGQIPLADYNSFQIKELAQSIGKNAGVVGMQSAALAAGLTMVCGVVSGEGIDSDQVIETALTTGADAGIKAAAAGAVKVGAEKGMIGMLPPGTPVQVIANVVCVGVENIKIMAKVASGELTLQEGLDRMGRTSVAMVAGLSAGATGAAVGAMALGWIPIVGPIVGGIAGGMVGYMAGSKFGETVYHGAKKVASAAKNAVSRAWEGAKSAGRKVVGAAKRFLGL